MDKKYELSEEAVQAGKSGMLYRVRALKDFSDVKAGDLGGFVSSENNLSQEGECWLYDDAVACWNVVVCDDAVMRDRSMAIGDKVVISGHSVVADNARVFAAAQISGTASVYGNSHIWGRARVKDNAIILNVDMDDDTVIDKNAQVSNTDMHGSSRITDDAVVLMSGGPVPDGRIQMCNNSVISGNAVVDGVVHMEDDAQIIGSTIRQDMNLAADALIQDDDDYMKLEGTGFSNAAAFRCADGTVKINDATIVGLEPTEMKKFRETLEQASKDIISGDAKENCMNELDKAEIHFESELTLTSEDLNFGDIDHSRQL